MPYIPIYIYILYSNTLKHVNLRHKQWHHAIGTVGVGRKPSQHYNALYGFMTMKEDILRDYQKPKDSEQTLKRTINNSVATRVYS